MTQCSTDTTEPTESSWCEVCGKVNPPPERNCRALCFVWYATPTGGEAEPWSMEKALTDEDAGRVDAILAVPPPSSAGSVDDPDAGAWNALIEAKERAEAEVEDLREELESARAQVTIAKRSNGFQLLDPAQPSAGSGSTIPLADHDDIGRKLLSQPWAIQSAIVTITAHCTALVDDDRPFMVADLAGCISQQCLELTNALCGDPAQSAWQPIETAPHETQVLLGYWYDGVWHYEAASASHGWSRNGISTMSRHGRATHWMPLPAPALSSTDRGGK